MNWANRLTLARIVAAPFVLVFLLRGELKAAFWLYVATALTDMADGFLARHFHMETKLGALLDPLADKVLMVTVYPALVILGRLEGWVLALFIFRDLSILFGWGMTYILLGETAPRTRWLGKASTAAQMILAVSLLLDAAYPGTARSVGIGRDLLPVVAVALTVASMLDYLITGSRRLGGAT